MSEAAVKQAGRPILEEHFADLPAQESARKLGMWVFLVTEVLFFGGLFTTYTIYRELYFAGFAQGSHLIEVKWGAINTLVLIVSSFTVALAIRTAQVGKRSRATVSLLLVTALLGALFLFIKFYFEWFHDFKEGLFPGVRWDYHGPFAPHAQLFFVFYYFMTGLHAIHVMVGMGIMCALACLAWRGRFSPRYYSPLEVGALYWHFVDIIWIFLFPLLYLIGGRS